MLHECVPSAGLYIFASCTFIWTWHIKTIFRWSYYINEAVLPDNYCYICLCTSIGTIPWPAWWWCQSRFRFYSLEIPCLLLFNSGSSLPDGPYALVELVHLHRRTSMKENCATIVLTALYVLALQCHMDERYVLGCILLLPALSYEPTTGIRARLCSASFDIKTLVLSTKPYCFVIVATAVSVLALMHIFGLPYVLVIIFAFAAGSISLFGGLSVVLGTRSIVLIQT